MLQDSHIHLEHVKDSSVMESILAKAPERRVKRFFCNAASPDDWDLVSELARAGDTIVPFYGIHPWKVDEIKDGWYEELKKRLEVRPVGVGEVGLDHCKNRPDHDLQKGIFLRQLDLAISLDLPVAIHCVSAWETMLEELRKRRAKKARMMFHLFSGSTEVLSELLGMGAFISFSFGISEGGSRRAREAFQVTPLNRILLETDYPYIQKPFKENVPGADDYFDRLGKLYKLAAELKGINEEKLEKAVWENGSIFMC